MTNNTAICHVIAAVVSSDGIMEESERTFLEDTMEELGLSDEERQQVRHFENEGAEDVVRNMPEKDKLFLRDGLLNATLADGKISPYEQEAVKRIAELMGL